MTKIINQCVCNSNVTPCQNVASALNSISSIYQSKSRLLESYLNVSLANWRHGQTSHVLMSSAGALGRLF